MAVENWVAGAGVGLTWTAAFGAETNSLASTNAILSSVAITNGTALDIFCDFSISLPSMTPTGAPYIGVYLYPLNQDGTTYGDGRFGSSTSAVPPSVYSVGNIGIVAAVGVQTGTLTGIVMPPGTFKFVVYNGSGVALSASAATWKYRTYNISMV
jgi:hypothetical protein